jgi:hypothetical protein
MKGVPSLAARLFFLAVGGLSMGCDRPLSRNPEVPIEKLILRPIEDVDDRASTPGDLQLVPRVFAPGSQPTKDALKRYAAYRYQGSHVVQSGDSATVTVAITDAKTGNPAGEMQWTLVKVGEVWRIQDAPLPP